MTAMMALLLQKVDGIQDAVNKVNVRTGEICSGSALCAGFKGAYYDETI